MIIRCAWCGKDEGEKEPLDDPRVSHTICHECHKKEMERAFQSFLIPARLTKGGASDT